MLATIAPEPVDHALAPDMLPGTTRRPKKLGGNIAGKLGGQDGKALVLPERFAALKQEICKNPGLYLARWRSVLSELEKETEVISQRGSDVVPQVSYSDIEKGLSAEQVEEIKKRGVVVIKGGVPKEEALEWKRSIDEYIALNKGLVTGGPKEKIVFYELYQTSAQIRARSHPALLTTQKALLRLWHNSAPPSADLSSAVSLRTPISYFDRLRIRPPGPSAFVLGPHIDGGGIERWEDPGFRSCFAKILYAEDGIGGELGAESWRDHDPFDAAPRLTAKQDLYEAANQCTVFRPWQGWTALSSTGAHQGTLQVLPLLTLSTAYIMLRPFFALRPGAPAHSLAADDWVLDLASTAFPGSTPGRSQEPTAQTHPHLALEKTLVSVPRVEPGDQVYWHCDLVHAVEAEHTGTEDSSVLYIPAVPLTLYNASYLRDQRETFKRGLPSPDFPSGAGESQFTGRFNVEDLHGEEAQCLFGLAPFTVPADAGESEKALIEAANSVLFG